MSDDLQKINANVPEFLRDKQDIRGREHITSDDIQMPRLAIAQGLSPEIQEGDPKFIEGLKFGQMFNSLTGKIYGKGPIEFYILKGNPPRGVEFNPREEGGGVKDRSVPLDDPRMQWGKDGEKPVATLYYDYLIMLLPDEEIIGLSMKSTNIKVAKTLNGLIQMRQRAIFAGKYKISSVVQKNAKGTYGTFQISNSGWVEEEDTYEKLSGLFTQFKDQEVQIHDSEADEEKEEFKGQF